MSCAPHVGGAAHRRFQEAMRVVQEGIDRGAAAGVVVAIVRAGVTLTRKAVGVAPGRPRAPRDDDVLRLWHEGRCDLDRPAG